jgi:predicted dehydrogenase
MNDTIWMIGCGSMALEYAKVFRGMSRIPIVIGRGKASAMNFKSKTGFKAIVGGISAFLEGAPALPSAAVIAVGVDELAGVTHRLLKYGVRRILLEKPGGLNIDEIRGLGIAARERNADIWIAYNRRYYASTLEAKRLIQREGGVSSFNFEFTEWSHVIRTMDKPKRVLNNWFLANSTHVVDLAFHLGGIPESMDCRISGDLDWHPRASVFCGSGISKTGALFTYSANWAAPGRWGVELLTNELRIILKPLEQLQIMRLGSVAIESVPIDDTLDKEYKPGLYRQLQSFLDIEDEDACLIGHQVEAAELYNRMAGYC